MADGSLNMRTRIAVCAFALVAFFGTCVYAQEQGTQTGSGQTAEGLQAAQASQTKETQDQQAKANQPPPGHVAPARLVHQVAPEYPQDAKHAHISGTVVLRVVIAKDGSVQNPEYVSGPPELTKSAMDAVKQWRYTPTLLNGEPIDVDSKISVVFTLGGEAPPAGDQGTQTSPGQSTEGAQSAVPTPKWTPTRIRVGANVQAASLIHKVDPEYPESAKQAHISGTVVLHAIIGKDGSVLSLDYVSGPPELTKASIDAVKQWRYKPTKLNGDPIEVDTTISVVFTLGG